MVRRIKNMNRYTRAGIALFLVMCMLGIGPMQDLSAGAQAATEKPATAEEAEAGTEAQDTDTAEGTADAADTSADSSAVSGSAAEDTAKTLYIKELRYFHGDKGKKKAEEQGWIVYDTDLNSGNHGDSLWLAYKTTTDKSEAITALKTMEMKGGYELTNYRKVMETVSKGLAETAGAVMTTAAEFRDNLDQGYKAASASKGLLNLFTLKEGGVKEGESLDQDKLLGNYLASGNYKSEDIQELIMQINPTMLSTILSRLAGGVFFREVNNVDKLPEMSDKVSKLSSSGLRTLDTRYQSTVLDMKEQLQKFSKDVREAQARAESNGGKIILSDGSTVEVDVSASGSEGGSTQEVDTDEIEKIAGEEAANGGVSDKGRQGDADLVLLSYLNVLNKYQFDDSTKLGDKIVELGKLQFTKYSEVRQVYPLVMALTPGQASIVRLCGVSVMIEGLIEDDAVYSTLESKTADLKSELAEKGYVAGPVWSVEDKSFYEGDIAYTRKLLRTNAAGATFTDVTKTTAIGKFWNEYQMASNMISGIASAIFSVGAYCLGVSSPTAVISLGASMVSKAWVASATAGMVKGGLVIGLGVIGMVAIAILVIALLVCIGKAIYNAFVEWDEYDYEESDIPKFLLDADETESGDMANVRYYLVDDPDENRGDLNCGQGKRWNALYYTRNEAVGDPICASSEDDFFMSVFGSVTEQVPGIEAVCSFNSPNAQSINAYALDKGDGNHYLYYRTSVNGELGVIAKGREEKTNGEYLADIRLFNGETETEAKAALARAGYKLYDTNVSTRGDAEREYSYIGYKVTNRKSAAVRDIRVCLGYPGTSVQIGDISYSPGQGEDEHTSNNAFICHTTNKNYGSPICWKNVFFVKDLSEVKEGWEPVSLTCGGPAFNWRESQDPIEKINKVEDYHNAVKERSLYMYYKPEEVYTEGEEYLSGIQFISGWDKIEDDTRVLEEMMEQIGVRPLGKLADNIGDHIHGKTFSSQWLQTLRMETGVRPRKGRDDNGYTVWDLYDRYDIYMTYTTTHNPYRALTDVRLYRSDYSMNGFAPQLSVGGYGYQVCETLQQFYEKGRGFAHRFYTKSHTYIGPFVGEVLSPDASDHETFKMMSKDGTGEVPVDYRGLYVSGYRKGGTPMKVSDIILKSDPGAPKGFHPVDEFLNAYDHSDKDLGYTSPNGEGIKAYLYVRGEAKTERPKYIKSIVGTYFETPTEVTQGEETVKLEPEQINLYCKFGPEQCRLQAIQMGADEIIGQSYTANAAREYKISSSISRGEQQSERSGRSGSKLRDYVDTHLDVVDNVGKKNYSPEYFSYIGVIRTDKANEAMRGAIKFTQSFTDVSARAEDIIKVGGVKYRLSGANARDRNGHVFSLYTSTQTGAGDPVTDIELDENPFMTGFDTMIGASETDKGSGYNQVFASMGLNATDEHRFIHMKRSGNEKTYYSRLMVSESPTGGRRDAECALLSAGCNRCIPLVMSEESIHIVMLGARTCSVDSPDIAIRDIVCTVGEEWQESFTKDGFEYVSAGKYSLNEGSNYGIPIYIYYTHGAKLVSADEYAQLIGDATEADNTPTSTEEDLDDWLDDWLDDNDSDDAEDKIIYMDQAPITRLAATKGDFLPEQIKGVAWEKILDTKGNRVNVNEGIMGSERDAAKAVDKRVYLFTAHEDGRVKPGAAITELDGKYKMLVGVMKLVGA